MTFLGFLAIIIAMLELYSVTDVQHILRQHLWQLRRQNKMSRRALAQRSTVPVATIKKFEYTGRIALPQFLLLWQSLAPLSEVVALTRRPPPPPKTIDEALKPRNPYTLQPTRGFGTKLNTTPKPRNPHTLKNKTLQSTNLGAKTSGTPSLKNKTTRRPL